jgi:glycerophosphoryl diester phosphodiesterase
VLDLIDKKIFMNIELKGENTAKPVVDVIESYLSRKNWNYNHFLVSSFDWIALQEVRSLNPKIAIGVLTQTDLGLAIAFADFIKAKSIHPYFHLLNEENSSVIKEKGFQVFPWTVNEQEDIQKIKSFHVDGIITDFPDRI